MSLSIEKCNIISYHRKNLPIIVDYVLSGSGVVSVELFWIADSRSSFITIALLAELIVSLYLFLKSLTSSVTRCALDLCIAL